MVRWRVQAHGQLHQECTLQNCWKSLLEIKNTLNNRPLTHIEDEAENLILTRNTFAIGQNLMLPDKNLETENKDFV